MFKQGFVCCSSSACPTLVRPLKASSCPPGGRGGKHLFPCWSFVSYSRHHKNGFSTNWFTLSTQTSPIRELSPRFLGYDSEYCTPIILWYTQRKTSLMVSHDFILFPRVIGDRRVLGGHILFWDPNNWRNKSENDQVSVRPHGTKIQTFGV